MSSASLLLQTSTLSVISSSRTLRLRLSLCTTFCQATFDVESILFYLPPAVLVASPTLVRGFRWEKRSSHLPAYTLQNSLISNGDTKYAQPHDLTTNIVMA
jgi:hypothetical protein